MGLCQYHRQEITMPLLTAAIIVCGALPQPGAPLACRAQVYHGIEGSQPACSAAALNKARSVEASFIKAGALVRTSSHAECFSSDDEGSIAFYLPEFMRIQLGAKTSAVVHYDVIDGAAVERAPDATAKEIGL
jgi:hypothetical protein